MKKKDLWLFGAAAAFVITASVLVFLRKDDDGKPPRKAPQLPLKNPGEQSNFPTSASESEVG